ncbi:MAG: sulfatase [Opitutales bacterium]
MIHTRKYIAAIASLLCVGAATLFAAAERPNVILIVCDDLNTDLQGYGGHPQVQTPNLQRLMDSATTFMSAHCNIPICAPSRSSFLTGVYPHHSNNFGFDRWYENEILQNTHTIFSHFKANGYHVLGTGKLMHHNYGREWSEFKHDADYGPYALDGEERVPHPEVPQPMRDDFGWVDGSYGPLVPIEGVDYGDGKAYRWGTGNWRGNRDLHFDEDGKRLDPTADEQNGQWAMERLQQLAAGESEQPFLMAVGFLRPHTPLIVDQRFFDLYPRESLELPTILENDAEDTFLIESRGGNDRGRKIYESLLASYPGREEALKRWVQAYLACVSSVDELIGGIVDVVDRTGLKENTIIVVTSDHGWGNGEKDYVYKNALWEESTRVPLIMRVPGLSAPGSESEHPVSLIDLFPTLIDLCGLPTETRRNEKGASLDGFSLRPLIADPATDNWAGPDAALTAIHKWKETDPARQSYSLRTKEWRYIRYHNGDEELYDCTKDPYEWHNLALQKKYRPVLKDFRKRLDARISL